MKNSAIESKIYNTAGEDKFNLDGKVGIVGDISELSDNFEDNKIREPEDVGDNLQSRGRKPVIVCVYKSSRPKKY